MKKVILTVVAVLSLTTAFAGNDPIKGTTTTSVYELNINMDKFSDALNLSDDQKEVVESIMTAFTRDLRKAGKADDQNRNELVKKAIDKDVKRMRRVLNREQMRTFLNVLNTTVANRGLLK